jgi:nucleotide-binding universal stress UspA family protein
MAERKVLIPLDGSEFSRRAIEAIDELFDADRVRLVLLRVGDAPPHVGGPVPRRTVTSEMILPEPEQDTYVWDSQEWESARQRLRDEITPDARRLEREGWTVEAATAFGDPAEEIVAFARDHDVDLVAMATHGRTGLSRALLGSVAERALRRLRVPVLMVRPHEMGSGEPEEAVAEDAATEDAPGSAAPEPG